ncbi:hypothetical protein A6P39_040175 [Streptomyces sp. FXJ1.172]|uniref:hypothetical protein n=1 Tax=Streptomyces sp. FXJ1.172 TaxID=710705 RepID=UPI0023DD4481|nr:hypothetical protein [Streptomyces sp. FXJ1.172]WEO99765.1 hypothetical protein A6P39_040175 [Streptomyces sp. FXJ1.172]
MSVQSERIHTRLDELKREYEQGSAQLSALLQQQTTLRETLLRISGAIQVLEELLPHGDQANGDRRTGQDSSASRHGPGAEPGTDAKRVRTASPS